MKHYFLIAKTVGDLTAIVCAALEEKEAQQPAVLARHTALLLADLLGYHPLDTLLTAALDEIARAQLND